jgi:signal transduction histidine kinase
VPGIGGGAIHHRRSRYQEFAVHCDSRWGLYRRAVFMVTDNGPGIAPDQHEKVFTSFFTTKTRGSGLGLTFVRQIATVRGVTIDISKKGPTAH